MDAVFNILVVDDDRDTVFLLKEMLEKKGFTVTTASDGEEALKLFGIHAPDLIITDLNMPEMDGWRLIMKIRQDKKGKTLPIIVLSALVADNEIKPEVSEPYNLLLSKPFDILMLFAKIKELLALA